MPYQVSLVFRIFIDILPCSSNSPIKIVIKHFAFSGLLGISSSKNSLKPSPSTSKNSGVPPHIHRKPGNSHRQSPSASAPVTVFTIFLVSTTSVRLFCSSILQMPRVTPSLSDRVFFSIHLHLTPLIPFICWISFIRNIFFYILIEF